MSPWIPLLSLLNFRKTTVCCSKKYLLHLQQCYCKYVCYTTVGSSLPLPFPSAFFWGSYSYCPQKFLHFWVMHLTIYAQPCCSKGLFLRSGEAKPSLMNKSSLQQLIEYVCRCWFTVDGRCCWWSLKRRGRSERSCSFSLYLLVYRSCWSAFVFTLFAQISCYLS